MNLMRANHSSISHVLYALKLISADGYISAQRMNKRFKPVCFGWMPWIQNSSDFTFRQSQFISNGHLCFARLSKTHKGGRFERGCDGDRYHVLSNLFSSRRRDIFAIINASANRHIQRIRGIFESLFKGLTLSNNFRYITASDNIAVIVFIFSNQYWVCVFHRLKLRFINVKLFNHSLVGAGFEIIFRVTDYRHPITVGQFYVTAFAMFFVQIKKYVLSLCQFFNPFDKFLTFHTFNYRSLLLETQGINRLFLSGFQKREMPKPDFFRKLFRISKNQIIWGANHCTAQSPVIDTAGWRAMIGQKKI